MFSIVDFDFTSSEDTPCGELILVEALWSLVDETEASVGYSSSKNLIVFGFTIMGEAEDLSSYSFFIAIS